MGGKNRKAGLSPDGAQSEDEKTLADTINLHCMVTARRAQDHEGHQQSAPCPASSAEEPCPFPDPALRILAPSPAAPNTSSFRWPVTELGPVHAHMQPGAQETSGGTTTL